MCVQLCTYHVHPSGNILAYAMCVRLCTYTMSIPLAIYWHMPCVSGCAPTMSIPLAIYWHMPCVSGCAPTMSMSMCDHGRLAAQLLPRRLYLVRSSVPAAGVQFSSGTRRRLPGDCPCQQGPPPATCLSAMSALPNHGRALRRAAQGQVRSHNILSVYLTNFLARPGVRFTRVACVGRRRKNILVHFYIRSLSILIAGDGEYSAFAFQCYGVFCILALFAATWLAGGSWQQHVVASRLAASDRGQG
jgi:hypothetical protein